MTEYKPQRGDFVEVVNRTDGWKGLRGIVTGPSETRTITPFYGIKFPKWNSPDGPCGRAQFMSSHLRPLVVLDLDGHDFAVNIDDIREALNEYDVRLAPGTALSMFEAIADQIEAQTKPPRIPEPGWGEKVIAHTSDNPTRRQFVRFTASRQPFSTNHWYGADDTRSNQWSQLIDPEPVA